MNIHRLRIPFAVALSLAASPVFADSVNFENVSLGTLSGQDGWTDFTAFGIPSPSVVDGSLYSVTNTTHVVRSGVSPAVAIHQLSTPSTAITSSQLRFDASLGSASGISILSLASADGTDAFAFGLNQDTSSSFFLFRRSSMFTGQHNLNVPITFGNGGSDWYRLRADIDYSANGGDGSLSLFEQDLTAGDGGFTPVPGLQNMNLGLTAANLASTQVTDWTEYTIRVDSSALLDNIVIGPSAETPEPGSLALLLTSGIAASLLAVRRRAGRSRTSRTLPG